MKLYLAFAVLLFAASPLKAEGWRTAEPGWVYDFPRDHQVHADFQTEWWYFTGNLFDRDGRRYGYELTFFREGVRPPSERSQRVSRFVVDDLKFAHFTVTDVQGERFHYLQKLSRGSFGEAGFESGERIAWIESWQLVLNHDGALTLQADTADSAIEITLSPQSKPVVHGENGLSRKAAGTQHASHYYSVPRLTTRGKLRVGGETRDVEGLSWFDHEWATNQLSQDQAGWNWLSVQCRDGTALMLYQMRLKNGGTDPVSSGTAIDADGNATFLPSAAFDMQPIAFWRSQRTGGNYPIAWRVRVPREQLDFTVRAALNDQELALTGLTYWEGAIDVSGTRAGKELAGQGYLELTGYAGDLNGLPR